MKNYLFLLGAVFLLAGISTNALAKSYADRIAAKEAAIQQDLKQFRIVKRAENFAERINATQSLEVDTKPLYATATLHDLYTGEPLESCLTPCMLHQETGRGYMIFVYKNGYFPRVVKNRSVKPKPDARIYLDLGINNFDVRRKQKKCRSDFEEIAKIDADPVPCYRHAPVMPRRAKHSGHCVLTFDLTARGRPVNIKALSCTDDIFKGASKSALSWWQYTPKVVFGGAVDAKNLETKISFRLRDEEGNIIPEDVN